MKTDLKEHMRELPAVEPPFRRPRKETAARRTFHTRAVIDTEHKSHDQD
jgi:hypothetical protein